MKQRVKVAITTPSTAYHIKLLAVYEVEGELIAISAYNSGGWGGDAISVASDAVVVNTSSAQTLPVKHYLTNIDEQDIEEDRHLGNYGKGEFYGAKDATDFTGVITDISEIQELLDKGKCLYEPRKDGLEAHRLGRAEANYGKDIKPLLEIPASEEALQPEQLQGIVNIFPVVDEGSFKVVVETVCNADAKKSFQNLTTAFNKAVEHSGAPELDLKAKLFMVKDDEFYFAASVAGESARYQTGAYEFTLPTQDVGLFLQFLRFLEESVKALSSSEDDYYQSYSRVQVSGQSVLAQFDELLISKLRDRNYNDIRFIEYPSAVSLEEFARQSVQAEKYTAAELMVKAFVAANLADYKAIQPVITELFEPKPKIAEEEKLEAEHGVKINPAGVVYFPMLALEKILGESVMSLRDPKVSMEDKRATVERIHNKLLDSDTFAKASSLLGHIQNSFVSGLMMSCLGQPAHDGGKYSLNYTELNLFFYGNFKLCEDGRVGFTHDNNPYYQKWYAKGQRNHDILKEELLFLSKAEGVELEFDETCDFHKEIVFSEACSARLIAQGVLLNAKYLAGRLVLREEQNGDLSVEPLDEVVAVVEQPITPKLEDILITPTAEQLRKQYPQADEIIAMLLQAKVFTDRAYETRHTLAQIFRVFAEFDERAEENKEKTLTDTPASLVKVHHMLQERGLLTAKTHAAVVGEMMPAERLEKFASLLEIAGEMDVAKAETLCQASSHIIMIWDMIKCFDKDNKALLHMLNKIDSVRFYGHFWDMLACERQFGSGPFVYMRPEDFILLLDNLKGGWHGILSGLGYLNKAGLLPSDTNGMDASIRDRFLTPEHFDLPLHDMSMVTKLDAALVNLAMDLHGEVPKNTLANLAYLHRAGILNECKELVLAHKNSTLSLEGFSREGMLTTETLPHIYQNKDYDSAADFCGFAGLTGWNSSIKKGHGEAAECNFKKSLLANSDATKAIVELRKVIRFVAERDKVRRMNGQEGKLYKPDLMDILRAAKVQLPEKSRLEHAFGYVRQQGLALFNMQPESLAECVARIKAKYQYEEPEVKQQNEQDAKHVARVGM